ncbi:MAG TPA: 60S ribosomal protein L26 [Candidatus Thermoplasmatota archaeon]
MPKASSKPRKQRKRHFNAPRHKVHRRLRVRNQDPKFRDAVKRLTVRTGDRVMIRAGQGEEGGYVDKDSQVKDVEGKVVRVDYKRQLIFLEDVKMRKRGNKVADRPVEPNNVWIMQVDLSDARRKAWLEGERAKYSE